MNYADFGLGTWHPKTGMFDVVRAMKVLQKSWSVVFILIQILKDNR
jgi:phytoene desaturase